MEHGLSDVFVLVVALGVIAQWLAWRFQFPAIILLSVAGLLAGPVLGLIHPDEAFGEEGLRTIISLGVAVILFEGGLNLRTYELKEAANGVQRLVTLGAAFNFILASAAAHYVGALSWPVSLVTGAILVVTGPTVIMPMLRQAMLNRRTASYLKWEAIINDPIGALLAVLVFQYFVFSGIEATLEGVMLDLGKAVGVALALGGGGGWLLVHAFRRAYVPEFLKAPVLLAVVFSVFALSNWVQAEAGLLTVTVLGIVIANMRLPSIDEMRRYKEYMTVLLVSAVFILLTANLEPSTLAQLDWHAAAFVLLIVFVVRPLAILLATIGAGMDWRDRVLVGWIGPRGIVAAAIAGIFAPDMVAAGYEDAALLVPVIFSVIFATVVLHGLSLRLIAQRLGLSATGPRNGVLIVGASPWTTELARRIQELGVRVLIVDNSWHRLREARLAGIPVFFGEILSERAEESLQFQDIAHLVAATSNDAYNALVCSAFAPELGQDRVYQLPMYDSEEGDRKGMAAGVRGRVAFDPEAKYEELWRRHHLGWRFQKTRFTETFTFEDYRAKALPDDMPVLLVTGEGNVVLQSVQHPLQPKPGDTLLTYTPSRPSQSNKAELTASPEMAMGNAKPDLPG